jgi:tetratricopeptide (TPR) repeat protein
MLFSADGEDLSPEGDTAVIHRRLFPLAMAATVVAILAFGQEALVNCYAALSPHIQKARAAFKKDRLDKCETEAAFCLGKLAEHHEAHFLMSHVLYKRGELEPALAHIEAAEKGYRELSKELALAEKKAGQSQSEDLLRVTEQIADLAGAYAASKSHGNGMSDAYERALVDSRQEMIKAEGERGKSGPQGDGAPVPALYRFWHGNVLFRLKRLREAEVQYKRALATDPDFGEAYNNLINLLYLDGRVDEARQVLAQAEARKAKIHPGLKKAVLGRGPSAQPACPFLSRNSSSSTGAPSSTIMATRTPSDGDVISAVTPRAASAASRSSTSKATWGTVRTSSETSQSGSKRIHSMPKGLVRKPATWILRCGRATSPG